MRSARRRARREVSAPPARLDRQGRLDRPALALASPVLLVLLVLLDPAQVQLGLLGLLGLLALQGGRQGRRGPLVRQGRQGRQGQLALRVRRRLVKGY